MTKLLLKLFLKNGDPHDVQTRKRVGTLAGCCGIVLNTFLFLIKLAAGVISGSISIVADALNNLSDAGSSVVTLVGSRIAAKRSDDDHPFGHGRMEYIAGLIVSFIVILLGFELFTSSVGKIFSPEKISFSWLSAGILVLSLLIKLWMWNFNRTLDCKTDSAVLRAAAADSLSDCAATTAVLLGFAVYYFAGVQADGYIGVLVAVFIMINGIRSAKETIDPLLGSPPDPELIEGIRKTVLSHSDIIGIHDLTVHDYGPGRLMISLHAEVPSDIDIRRAHDTIDIIEKQLGEKFGCDATIHMDPIDVNDERTNLLKAQVEKVVFAIDERLSIHDFRITAKHTHTNLIFDICAPFGFSLTDAELTALLKSKIHDIDENYFAVIKVDHEIMPHERKSSFGGKD